MWGTHVVGCRRRDGLRAWARVWLDRLAEPADLVDDLRRCASSQAFCSELLECAPWPDAAMTDQRIPGIPAIPPAAAA